MSSFSKNLRQLRREAGMTQDQLAGKLNVTRQAISAWERDCTQPDIESLILLAQTLGVEVNDLLLGRNEKTKPPIQKADMVIPIASFAISSIILVLQLTLYPYLRRLLREQWLPYAVSYQRILPPIGFFAGGIFLASLAALFWDYQKRMGKRLRCFLLISSVFLCLPALLVMLEEVICLFTSDLPVSISAFLIKCCVRNPGLSVMLFNFFPLFSGMLAYPGKGRRIDKRIKKGDSLKST